MLESYVTLGARKWMLTVSEEGVGGAAAAADLRLGDSPPSVKKKTAIVLKPVKEQESLIRTSSGNGSQNTPGPCQKRLFCPLPSILLMPVYTGMNSN